MDPHRAKLQAKHQPAAAAAAAAAATAHGGAAAAAAVPQAPIVMMPMPVAPQHAQPLVMPGMPQFLARHGDWEQMFDQTWQAPYYRNRRTNTTQWTVPAEWPVQVGEKLSGSALAIDKVTHDKAAKYLPAQMEAYQKRLMKRPARRQAEMEDASKLNSRPEGAEEYNIWYHKWCGTNNNNRDREPAATRCSMEKDAGKTRADVLDPEARERYFCLHFARGACRQGPDCSFFHRIPTEADALRIDASHDVFGRERHSGNRDDMGGVGSFESDSCTIYVGGLGQHKNLEEVLWREFGEWGTPTEIKIIDRLAICFVRYNSRLNAEFAKIAMADQLLEGQEQINVRWAMEDPNPAAKARKLMNQRTELLAAAEARGIVDNRGELPGPKRIRAPGDAVTAFYPAGPQLPIQQ